MRQLKVTLQDDARQARTTAAAQTNQSATETQVLGWRRTTIVDTGSLETSKNSDDQFKFVFLDCVGFVDMKLELTRAVSVTMQRPALEDSMSLLLEGSAKRFCLLEHVYDGEGLFERHVVASGDDLTVVDLDTSSSLEFLTQARPVDESGSKTRRRGRSEVLPDNVRPAAIQMNPEDDPRCCLIARGGRFTTYPFVQTEIRSIVMVRDTLIGAARTVLLDRLDRVVRNELDDKTLGCVCSDQLPENKSHEVVERR